MASSGCPAGSMSCIINDDNGDFQSPSIWLLRRVSHNHRRLCRFDRSEKSIFQFKNSKNELFKAERWWSCTQSIVLNAVSFGVNHLNIAKEHAIFQQFKNKMNSEYLRRINKSAILIENPHPLRVQWMPLQWIIQWARMHNRRHQLTEISFQFQLDSNSLTNCLLNQSRLGSRQFPLKTIPVRYAKGTKSALRFVYYS